MTARGFERKNLIQTGVALALGVLVYLVPIPGIPDPAKRCLAILAVASYLWVTEAVPLFATAFLVVLAEALLLSGPLKLGFQVFLAPFFDPVIMLFLGGFILSQALAKYDLDGLLASAILRRTGAKPKNVLLGMMAVAAFLSMWMSNTAATALLVGLALTIIRRLDADDPFRVALILGIPFAANIGGVATPIGTPPNAIAIGILAERGIQVSFVRWMAIGLPVTAAIFLVLWRLLLRLFPARAQSVALPPPGDTRLDARQWTIAAVFAATILLWLTAEFHRLPSAVIAVIPAFVFTGLRILDKEDFGRVGWDILILMGGGLSLGVAIRESGLTDWVLTLIRLGGVNPVLLTAALTVVAMVVTTFISNTSTAALLLPLVAGLAPDPVVPVLAVAIGVSVSMVLPVSTPPNAIAYGSGLVSVRTMARVGLILSAIALVIVVLGVVGLARLLDYAH
ncbi:MAG: SLC13 family permease [bacterium]